MNEKFQASCNSKTLATHVELAMARSPITFPTLAEFFHQLLRTDGLNGGTLPPSLHSLLLIQGNIYAHCSQCVPLLRGPSWNICSLSGCRRTGSSRCCALWSTYFIKGLIELITAWISALTTGPASVLITSLTGGLAGLPTPSPNPDYSWNVALTSHIGLFHPDGISEIARISKTGARGFVHGQFGRVAGRHQPTDIILA